MAILGTGVARIQGYEKSQWTDEECNTVVKQIQSQ